ncbi:hybrid sensor histidine kinase/response regulator [Peribacillus deserti]|uniref:Circadian input-output histidine kinase CikA n=1 Tax=Peribacillus deserti TaxID=673318 RepID=A0A2N5M3G1_9BACI|nr:response regulator [Peribacillus deserti]PLT28897.1 hybrid sensor histidine kinase/response regulator [Peribacillus deserti]
MGFKKKQFIGLGLTVFFMFLLLSVILLMMQSIKANMLEIVQDRYHKVNEATEIRQMLYKNDRELVSLFSASDKELEHAAKNFQAQSNSEEIHTKLLELETILNRNKSKVLVKQVRDAYDQYSEMESNIAGQLQNKASKSELQAIYNQEQASRDNLFLKIDEFKVYQESLMKETLADSTKKYDQLIWTVTAVIVLALILIVAVMLWVIRSTVSNINSITKVMNNVDYTNLSEIPRIQVKTKDEIGDIAVAFNSMAASIEEYNAKEQKYTSEIQEQNWIQTNAVEIVNIYSRHVSVNALAEQFIRKLAPVMGASLAAFYLKDDRNGQPVFKKAASYAESEDHAGRQSFLSGEGIIGQCVKEKRPILLNDIPADYRVVSTGLGEVKPNSILIAPVMFKDEVVGVVEFASVGEFASKEQKLLENVLETLGIGITNILGRMEVERLLIESQAQTEELQAQSEELQSQSEELQAQSEELQSQTEELRMTNEQLEERSRDAELKSEELQAAKEQLEDKAKELQLSSKYKSEFLANMSHELRTPLNSILLLSEMLSDDPDYELSEEQKEFANVIHSSGQDLLNLINDILDLSKIEAGKLEVSYEEVYMNEFIDRMERNFLQTAKKKNIDFEIHFNSDVPPIIYTDEQRLQQILKNLLSNAFKFTEKGSVSINVEKAQPEEVQFNRLAPQVDTWVRISVSDTGIGIARDKQFMIFEAFQQVDGAIMRRYGGTGLGLSITKEFTQLLGGTCLVESQEGKGSTFTIIIPNLPGGMPAVTEIEAAEVQAAAALETAAAAQTEIEPSVIAQTEIVEPEISLPTVLSGKTVVVADDDHRNIFALKNALLKEGMNVVTAENGAECIDKMMILDSVDIVLMDIMMPVMDGYEAMKRIRAMDRNVPIIALTAKAMKGDREKCIEAGATDYISKPLKLDQLLSAMQVWLS